MGASGAGAAGIRDPDRRRDHTRDRVASRPSPTTTMTVPTRAARPRVTAIPKTKPKARPEAATAGWSPNLRRERRDRLSDWNPGAYARFRDLRLRPATGPAERGQPDGCGRSDRPWLRQRRAWRGALARAGGREVIGVDASPAMLEKARQMPGYDSLATRRYHGLAPAPRAGADLFQCRAALGGQHEDLMPRLAGMLGKGGTLAVQMPHQNKAPSHRVWLSSPRNCFPAASKRRARPVSWRP